MFEDNLPRPHPRAAVGLACALVASLASFTATSLAHDSVEGTRSDKLVERSHRIVLTMDRGDATMVVRPTVFNGGTRSDQAMFHIFLPGGAVATGLRTAGVVDGRTRWFVGDLMEAEAAAERYRELTGIGGYYPKDPALLSWRSQGHLALQVFPCPPQQPKTVEYTLRLPTEYKDGAHHLSIPALGTGRQPAFITVAAVRSQDRLSVDGKPIASGSELKTVRDGYVDVTLSPYQPPLLDGALASKVMGPQRALSHFSIEAAPKLSTVPSRARVVVLLDSSLSLTPTQRSAQAAAASAVLAHFVDAYVQIIPFDRFPHPRYPTFVAVDRARTDLASLHLMGANGSHVDAALVEASRQLARVAPGVDKRVIVFTDARARSQLTAERLTASLGRGALVHIGVIGEGDPSLVRDDEHAWASVARSTGGVVWHADATTAPVARERMTAVYEELARPLRIDHLKISTPAVAASDLDLPEALDEGQGVTDLRIATSDAPWVRVEGELWASKISEQFARDDGETRLWSALVFGSPLVDELTEVEMMPLAMHGGAVSPVTSYLAIEPGVRPSTEGLEWGEAMGSMGGAGGLGLSGFGRGGGGAAPSFDAEAWFRSALATRWAACGGQPGAGMVAIETTRREIVDVSATERGASPASAPAQCLGEAAWNLALPSDFYWDFQSWSVAL
jgi:hypothetical protein